MIELIPEYKTKKLILDNNGETVPGVGSYLVSVKKGRKPGTVYQVCDVRKVNSKTHLNRYCLEVVTLPKLLPLAVITFRFRAFVNGAEAYTVIWNRNKKRK